MLQTEDMGEARVVFVGRRAQLQRLGALRKAVAPGRGCVVLLCGEAGSGKTALLEEFVASLPRGRALWMDTADRVELRRGSVTIAEDAHAASAGALETLLSTASSATRNGALLIVSYRRTDLDRDTAKMIVLAKLARLPQTTSIELESLDDAESSALARALVPQGASLSNAALDLVQRRSGGNPLLLCHLVPHAVKLSSIAETASLPLAVSGIVAEWLQPLDDADREILRYASLMRDCFESEDVAGLITRDAQVIAAALRRGAQCGVISERRGVRTTYRFRHGVVAETLERTFLPSEARALHEKLAHAIEASQRAEQRAGELAEHWLEAGNGEMALMYAERAGDNAFVSGGYEKAALWYERGASLGREIGAMPHGVYEKLANALERCGFAFSSHEALQAAVRGFDTAGENERATRLRIYDAIVAQYESDLTAGFARIQSAVGHGLGAGSQRYAQAVAAFLLALRHESDRALELVADFPHDDADVDIAARSKYWEVIGYCALQRADPMTARRGYRNVLELARQMEDPAAVAEAEANCAIYEFQLPGGTGDDSLQRAIAVSQERGLPVTEAYARGYAALNDFLRGRLEESRAHLLAMLPLATDMPVVLVARMYAGFSTGLALCDETLLAACARPELLEMAFRAGSPGVFGRVAGPYARWLVHVGRIDEARAVLHRCIAAIRNVYGTFLTMPAVAMYSNDADVEAARSLLVTAGQNPHDHIAAATLPMFDALRARSRGDTLSASSTGGCAAQAYARMGWTTMQAWALEVAGRLPEALSIYRLCGNVGGVRRIELSEGVAAAVSDGDGGSLSRRERAIVALVAEGKSNRAIATSLAISEKTVEGHLTTIFEKLGFRSRTELAASAAAHRLASKG
jgi:DNA-binding CsgD family transcriptional regulator/type II secretory pathway predicted ATPase ExeA